MTTDDGRCDYNLDHRCKFTDDVEDIAKAIFASDWRDLLWSEMPEESKNRYRKNARAVIEMLKNRKEQ